MLASSLEDILGVPSQKLPSFLRSYFAQYSRMLGPVYRFEGRQPVKKEEQEVVLIVGGIHPSEPSGSEIANWLRVQLETGAPPPSPANAPPLATGGSAAPLKGDAGPPPAKGPMGPYYTTVIIPAVFRSMYEQGRRSHPVMTQPGSERDTDRTVRGAAPARQFPPPSFSSGWLFQRGSATGGYFPVEDDRKTAPPNNWTTLPPALLPEIGMLMLLVDALRPKRIASLHGKRLKPDAAQAIQRGQGDAATLERLGQKENLPAIYVDPRYSFSLQARRMDRGQSIDPQKFTLAREPHYPQVRGDKTTFSATDPKRGVQDDDLCLKLAQAVNTYAASIPTPTSPGGRAWSWSTYSRLLVVGNLLDMSVPTVHYAYEGSGPGFSLGDWGPVDVATDGAAAFSSGKRAGAAVYTFETFGYADSGAFKLGAKGFEQVLKADGTPLDPSLAPGAFDTIRCLQLQAYASALRWEFLEEYKEQKREDG